MGTDVKTELLTIPEAQTSIKAENVFVSWENERSVFKKEVKAIHLPSFMDKNQIKIAKFYEQKPNEFLFFQNKFAGANHIETNLTSSIKLQVFKV